MFWAVIVSQILMIKYIFVMWLFAKVEMKIQMNRNGLSYSYDDDSDSKVLRFSMHEVKMQELTYHYFVIYNLSKTVVR